VRGALAANASIKAAMGANPVGLSLGMFGGHYGPAAGGAQTIHALLDIDTELTGADLARDLTVGLYDGVAFGSGISGITLDISVNSTVVVHQAFTSGSEAQLWFQDRALSLGTPSASMHIDVDLNITATNPGDGFFGRVIVGL